MHNRYWYIVILFEYRVRIMGLENWSGRSAVVTGAGSGFGEAITRLLAKIGMKIIAVDINFEVVQKVADSLKNSGMSGEIHTMKCDVADETAVKNMYAQAANRFGGVDVSVQCAGLSKASPLLSGDANDWRIMQEVNVLGTLFCCREAVNLMKKNGVDDGVLINLVSLAAHNLTPISDLHFYGATKVMLKAIQEGFRQELREINSNIRISGISPGQGNTGFYPSMFGGDVSKSTVPLLQKQLEAEDIAHVVEYILNTPKHVQIHDVLLRPVAQP
ncbi:dehydrogenase/reductase SDR family member 11-like [Lytechinus variegatus]|uniref:dehydrogenase/reductase SDR family member 11-like n=1 Tax=Lytechinus variegatus TaxID=7654 RepID=UPI001BB18D01|nr:dehydrogenase/reductase SDR family member 11-like [Lytechinus variegatus]